MGLGRILFWPGPDTGFMPDICYPSGFMPDIWYPAGFIPDIWYPAGYPALTGYPADNRITGYLGRFVKQTFCQKKICTIPYYALGAQITAPYFGFFKKIRRGTFVCFLVYFRLGYIKVWFAPLG